MACHKNFAHILSTVAEATKRSHNHNAHHKAHHNIQHLATDLFKEKYNSRSTMVHPSSKRPSQECANNHRLDRNQSITAPYSLKSIIESSWFSRYSVFLIPVIESARKSLSSSKRGKRCICRSTYLFGQVRKSSTIWAPLHDAFPLTCPSKAVQRKS